MIALLNLGLAPSSWVCLLSFLVITGVSSFGIQSGPADDNTFAGAMVYDYSTSHVYLSGLTYDESTWSFGGGNTGGQGQPHCFIARLNRFDWNWNSGTLLAPSSMCAALTMLDESLDYITENLFVAGDSKSGGFGFSNSSSGQLPMGAFGTLMHHSSTGSNSDTQSLQTTTGVSLSGSSRIEYPQFVLSHGRNIYSISLSTLDTEENEHVTTNLLQALPYGKTYDMTVRKLLLEQDEFLGIPSGSPRFVSQWKKEFPVEVDSSTSSTPSRVHLGGAIIMPNDNNQMLIVGATRGSGSAYGSAERTDEDGFLAVLDLSSGDVVRATRYGTDKADVIMGVCKDPSDPGYIYVVGGTQGTMSGTVGNEGEMKPPNKSLFGFVSKLSIDQLVPQWSRQWGARMQTSSTENGPTAAVAISCSVRGSVVYVAGDVENGASIIKGLNLLTSNGKDDIWAAALSTASGEEFWIQQIGTDGHDRLSQHGGVIADVEGHLMLYGDTTGSLFRTKSEDTADVFFMILEPEKGDFSPIGSPVAPPTPEPTPATEPPVALPTSPPATFTPLAAQLSGEHIYAGAITYDSKTNQAIITGQLIVGTGSECFLSFFDLTTGELSGPIRHSTQACTSIASSPSEGRIYLGSVDEKATSKFTVTGNPNTVVLGVLMGITKAVDLSSYALLEDSASQYPVQIILHPNQEAIFVAMDASDSGDGDANDSLKSPNFGYQRPYGSSFYSRIERYELVLDGTNMELVWTKKWNVDDSSVSVFTSGMTLIGDTLIVVGSTKGSSADGPFGEKDGGDDMDGFILKMDSNTGDLTSVDGHHQSTRLDSINHMDDWVLGVCKDVFDESSVYLVGKSQGKVRDLSDDEQPPSGTTHAFVVKVDIATLAADWLRHFTMKSSGEPAQGAAYSCAVTTDGLVYVAGVIEDGAFMNNATVTPGAGEDDIFVIQMNGRNGLVNWIQQVGSPSSDRLSQRESISVDMDGNAIVYAETYGSLFAEWSGTTQDHVEAAVFTMKKEDGSYADVYVPGSPPSKAPVLDLPLVDVLPDSITALQTGPAAGPSYAGGMFYNWNTNAIYVTGATYGRFSAGGVDDTDASSCLFGILSLPTLQWIEREIYGTPAAPEACSAISLASTGTAVTAVIVGSTEEGGMLTNLGTKKAKQYGIVLDLVNTDGRFGLRGGALMDEEQVQFPVAVETADSTAWVVSMTARETTVNPDFTKVSSDEHPNLTAGGIHKFGSNYRIAIDKYAVQSSGPTDTDGLLEETLQLKWRKPFETTDQESIYVADLILVQDGSSLILVGSTKDSTGSSDMDGIMTKINPDDGTFASGGGRAVAYFSSVSGRDDFLLGACPDPDDATAFYVVGATQGTMDRSEDRSRDDVTVHAVVAKIHVDKLTTIWTKQFSVTHASGTDSEGGAAVAFGCDVINGAEAMYIAGTVENGAVMDQGDQESAGRDDIFVAKLLTKDGSLVWMKQVGSNGDDRVAHGGGVKVDANGNAVVYGDTNGSFFRNRAADGSSGHYSDLFVMIFDQADGSHRDPFQAGPTSELPADTSTPWEWYPNGVSRSRSTLKLIIFASVALVLFCVILTFFFFGRRQAQKDAARRKASVYMYLQKFAVKDIDLRESPPGGWHGTYLNKLAYGINKMENDEEFDLDSSFNNSHETTALTHSSIARDSLFVDITSPPALGSRDRDDPTDTPGRDNLQARSYSERSNSLTMKEMI